MSPIADLQEQLQAILGDPEAMGQITAIARALTGSAPSPVDQSSPAPPPDARDVEFVPVEPPTDSQPEPQIQQSPDLSGLLSALGGGNAPDIDPKLVSIALRVFSEYSSQDDEKTALLSALKPFLRAERLEKMEKAEKISRLSRVVRVAIQLLKEEGGKAV